MENFKYTETMDINKNFWLYLYLIEIQQITTHSQWSQGLFSLGNACCHLVQKQQTFHHMCRTTAIKTHKTVLSSFYLVMKLSLEGIREQGVYWVCTDVTWAKTAQSCLWLGYRLDNPGLSFQQSEEVFLCHKCLQKFWDLPTLLCNACWGFFLHTLDSKEGIEEGMKQSTHLHVVHRLQINGAVSQYSSTECANFPCLKI